MKHQMTLPFLIPNSVLSIVSRWISRFRRVRHVSKVNSRVEEIEKVLLNIPQIDAPLTHRFSPGVYLREIFMPAGSLIIGHEHKTEHFNIILQGKALVNMDGVIHEIAAPDIFISKPGVRKILLIQEDMRWATIHPTKQTNIGKLEDLLVIKSESFVKHHEVEALKNHIESKSIADSAIL